VRVRGQKEQFRGEHASNQGSKLDAAVECLWLVKFFFQDWLVFVLMEMAMLVLL
jgi:hypothetical protein